MTRGGGGEGEGEGEGMGEGRGGGGGGGGEGAGKANMKYDFKNSARDNKKKENMWGRKNISRNEIRKTHTTQNWI